jgi:hypothetical protein
MQKTKTRTPLGRVALMLAFGLVGCNQNSLDNQIEKCVQAVMKSGEPYKDAGERYGTEVRGRIACLKAASGQRN